MTEHREKDGRWGLTEELLLAADAAELRDWQDEFVAEAQRFPAAYRLAVAVGRCLLFGIEPPVMARTAPLRRSVLHAALVGSLPAFRQTANDLQTLDEDLAESKSSIEADELVIRVLETRLDLEAAFRAYQQGIQAAQAAGAELPPALRARELAFEDRLGRLDDLIDENGDLLCLADATFWVENLSRDLPERSWRPRPWWLTDEIRCRRVAHEAWLSRFSRAGHELEAVGRLDGSELRAPISHAVKSPESDLTLAADAKSGGLGPELLKFELTCHGEPCEIVFRGDPQHRATAPVAYPDAMNVTVGLEVEVTINAALLESELDERRGIRRAYKLRWGLVVLDVLLEQTLREGAPREHLYREMTVPWKRVRPLYDAAPDDRRIFLRRYR